MYREKIEKRSEAILQKCGKATRGEYRILPSKGDGIAVNHKVLQSSNVVPHTAHGTCHIILPPCT